MYIDLAAGDAGSLWRFKDNTNRPRFSFYESLYELDRIDSISSKPSNLTLMYLGCNDEYGDKKLDGFFDNDMFPPNYYKMMVVDGEGECSIGWIPHCDAVDLRRIEE